MTPLAFRIEFGQGPTLRDRFEPGSLTLLEPELDAERLSNHQDVREQDDPVEGETTHGLKSRLRRQNRVVTEIEEGPCLRSQRPVLGEVSPRLTHEPERWRVLRLPSKRREKRLDICVHGHESALVPGFVRLSSLNDS